MKKCLKGRSLSDSGLFDDPGLIPYADIIGSRLTCVRNMEKQIKGQNNGSVYLFSDYHNFFGLHLENSEWIFREWAPNADDIYIICDKTSWQADKEFQLLKTEKGIFEKKFPISFFSHGDIFRLKIFWPGGQGDRIPSAAVRVVQDPETLIFNAQVWYPHKKYQWKVSCFLPPEAPLLIYEAHAGMALEEDRVGTYVEFANHILPKIVHAGYNTLQLMAVQEHPYYASFGYHVSSFFAPSSRFGTPEELKNLIDKAHEKGIRVLIDIIHSHSVSNEVEGLSRFDGTLHQFFHDGPRGIHRLWDSRCFDYAKPRVLSFLLSNLRYWIEEFNVDGFRFDGITSMLFKDHGIGRSFSSYDDYFGPDVDIDALTYLFLANKLVHEIKKEAVTIAEDVSGYPGLAAEFEKGGFGFDYRFSMGIADFWIKLLKDFKDENWPMGSLWHELTTRRNEEKTISYAECHDQALVGDKTLMMRLMGSNIYSAMEKENKTIETVRAVALHKMIRLITIATSNAGYLNFMGNEFGHPEWVDFPSKQNNFSYHYARRQWSLKYDTRLYYGCLFEFDRQMLEMVKNKDLFSKPDITLLHLHDDDNIIVFKRNHLIFVFNFHPVQSYTDYMFDTSPGRYSMLFSTEDKRFGGMERLKEGQVHFTVNDSANFGSRNLLSLYLPSRSALVLIPE